ncbi:MAG TPA: FdtA/QdtA family cupin domain-containing protein [Chitinophagales bacterium]|nr:FdtA/QdtA family cupin domain-containing protein [Chitinophagales bacterium]
MNKNLPKIISYDSLNQFEGKTITIIEGKNLTFFNIKRFYWINYSAHEITNSEHAHKSLHQIIIAIDGKVTISLESTDGEIFEYNIQRPNEGLYIPPMFWKKIKYKKPCVLLCLASEPYDENDYIRNYEEFKLFQK